MKNSARLLVTLIALSFASTGFAGADKPADKKPADKKEVVCDCGDACKNSDKCCCKAKEHKDEEKPKPAEKK